ncbi:MAG: cell wall hydrolase [Peptostreptococcales bacterium]
MYSNRELFARLIRCEAEGEGENGMKAVANVVMNRVHVPYGEYFRTGQGDLRRIINQQGQFDCVRSEIRGLPNPQTVWASPPEQIHYDIADWALSGNSLNTTGESLWYMNPFVPQCPPLFPYNGSGYHQVRINNHCFFNPTAKYAQT